MICSTCGSDNEAGRRFCDACGARFGAGCPSCGAANRSGARFCGECGSRLPEDGTGEVPITESRQPPVAERRLVTVLFADLVGFTPFAEERDPEEVRATLGRYFELATEVTSRYGGVVEKFIGDAVMAVWGAPTAHEDDAERAVRAGLDLIASVPTVGPGIEARVGIMTGEVAVTIGAANQGLVAGDLVNTAARLQAVAPPGWVLVGEATQRSTSRAISFEATGEQALKGKATPVPAWRAVRVVAERGGRNRTETLEPPFVGREDELRLIKDLYHATSREGRARLVSVIGPAGIGKTRLAWEFSKYLDGLVEGVWFHEGRSPSYGEGITFWALGEMVRRRAGLAETDDEETTRAKVAATVAEHVPDDDERRWIESALLALLGLERDLPSDQLFAAWRTFFERLASSGPVVLVFEDFHHADPGLLDFVDHLMDWARGAPIYVLTLARPELLERRKDWALGKRSFVGLTLEPLPDKSMRTMLEGLVHGLPEAAREAIVVRAEGVPLYAVEIVRMLAADGRLIADGDGYRAQGDLGPITMPETLTALISSRLDALDPADRALLQDGSILGLSFVPAHLAAVAGIDLTVVETRLRALVEREFLALVVDQRSPERGQYRFVQAVIREVAYNTLARPDRKARHLAAARSFEMLGTPEIAGALAGHYLAARDLAPEGPERDALAGQARLALVGAAERAADLGAHDQALTFFEQALSVASAPNDRAGLLERAGASATHAGHHVQATAMLTEAVELRRTLGDREAIAAATAKLAGALFMGHDIERATTLLRAAVDELSDIAPSPSLVELQALLARALFLGGDSRAAIGIADEALAAAERAGAVPPLADLLVTRGSALWDVGQLVEGMGVIEIGERLARSNGLTTPHLRALNNRAVHLFDVDMTEARAVVREAIAVARRIGSRDWELNFRSFAGRASLVGGDFDEALATWRESLELAPEREVLLPTLDGIVTVLAARGHPVEKELDEIDRLARLVSDPQIRWTTVNTPAIAAFLEGRLEEAGERWRTPAPAPEWGAISHSWWYRAGRTALWLGDVATARSDLATLRAVAERTPFLEFAVGTIAAGVDALEHRVEEASARYREVLDGWSSRGFVFEETFCAMDAAMLLPGDDPFAAVATGRAEGLLTRLGARPLLDRLETATTRARSTLDVDQVHV